MASAAALTLGVVTIPVYEIYKVGDDPRWLDGLDLLGPATGLRAAVVPHYDNAEGGTHDTRFCYMGERRLRTLEAALPDGTFILGVDGHTALVLDLEAGIGLGRRAGRRDGPRRRPERRASEPAPTVPIAPLGEVGAPARGRGRGRRRCADAAPGDARPAAGLGDRRSPLRDEMTTSRARSSRPSDADDMHDAVRRCSTSTRRSPRGSARGEDSPDLDNASATFRSLIARLGERRRGRRASPRARALEPFVARLARAARRRARRAATGRPPT